jgi:hypothetical protein
MGKTSRHCAVPPCYVLALRRRSLYSAAPLSNDYQCQRTRAPPTGWWRCRSMTRLPTTNAVKNRWFGLGDYATDQPGR